MQKYIKKEIAIGEFKYSRHFTEFELNKDNLLFCHPLFYIDNYHSNSILEEKHIYNQLLFVFNKILKFFFRSPLKLSDWQRNFIKNSMTEYLLFRNILVNGKYDKNINASCPASTGDYLKMIMDIYHDLDSLGKTIRVEKTEHHLTIKDFNGNEAPFNGSSYSAIRFMRDQVKTRLAKQIDFFLIHGSYATADFVRDWSDLDTFVILNKGIFSNIAELEYAQKELQKLSLLCYKINPLAHHTLFIFPDFILKHHLNVFLPIPVLEQSLALKKKDNLTLWHADSRLEEFNDFWNSLANIRDKVITNNYSRNLVEWEDYICHILMLPTFVLQIREGPLYKKHSFERIKEVFPNLDLGLIDWATEKRRGWKFFNLLKFYPNIFFNLLPINWNNFFVNKYRFYLMRFKKPADSPQMLMDYTQKALNLYENLFNYCLKNSKHHV